MSIFKIARYEIRPEARAQVEAAIAEFAAYVGAELAGTTWATYRDAGDPHRYVSIITAESPEADRRHREAPGTRRFVDALYPTVVGDVEFTDYELLADSKR